MPRFARSGLAAVFLAWTSATQAQREEPVIQVRPEAERDVSRGLAQAFEQSRCVGTHWSEHGRRDSAEVALAGRLLARAVPWERGPADTGRRAVDSARVLVVERWADDAPRWAREAVRREAGRLPIVRAAAPPPGCDARMIRWRAAEAERALPSADSLAIYEVRLVADTVAGRPRVFGVAALTETYGWRLGSRRPPGPWFRRDDPGMTPTRFLAWWSVLGALGAGRRSSWSEDDEPLAGDTTLARRIVAWAEAHRDSASTAVALDVVHRARRLLQDHAYLGLRSPLEGRWRAVVRNAAGVQDTFTLEAVLLREGSGVPRIGRAAAPVDTSVGASGAVTQPIDPLGPPGWRPERVPAAFEVALAAGDPRCGHVAFLRANESCRGTLGRLTHDARPSFEDEDSVVYAVALDLSSLDPLGTRLALPLAALADAPESAQLETMRALYEAMERLPRALRYETRQGRCVVSRFSQGARCHYRGLAVPFGEVLEYEFERLAVPR